MASPTKSSIESAIKSKLRAANRATKRNTPEEEESHLEAAARLKLQLVRINELPTTGSIGHFDTELPSSQVVLARRKKSAVEGDTWSQLPVVAESKKIAPNSILRSALFSVIKKGTRGHLTRKEITAASGYSILFTGIQLDQADLDVWLHCLRLTRDALGEPVIVSLDKFLSAIGRARGGSNAEWLRDSLARLGSAVIQVKSGPLTLMLKGRMVCYDELEQESRSAIRLTVSPSMAKLFGFASWSALSNEVRKKLIGHPLAQWLHAFYATHTTPIPIAISTLRELCGTQTSELFEFRRNLKEAAARLEEVGFIHNWSVGKEKFTISRVRGA